ncbi:uncharacterized protein LOC109835236 [Asparagus officinalis]|uniref:uncharacterized protein LOC109835236 n=1 Tax=Asparagus officinalis TaxID=4686 RepID=UPI00098DE751|nr:uncharacterized protein LOC109835236 [Asparagus officinalis]
MDQEDQRGPGKNKRTWIVEEDQKLVDALLELHQTGKYNANRGFKSRHYNVVERLLAISLPNSGLKADPHIRSRMKTLKTQSVLCPQKCYTIQEKAFPHLDTLSIVFGKDRATRKGMEHPYDVIEELDRKAGHDIDADDIPSHILRR